MDRLAVETLQAVAEHRAVRLVPDLLADVDDQVGADTQDVGVEGAVMEPAEGQAVRQDGLAPRVPVRKDVRGVEELRVAQAADRAPLLVRAQDAPPEALLVEAPAGQLGDVPASSLADEGGSVLCRLPRHVLRLDLDREGQRARVIAHDEDGPDRQYSPGTKPKK